MSEKKARIFVVDDHPMAREYLALLINAQPDLSVCGAAESAQAGLQGIASTKPDVAIIDLTLKQSYGMDLIRDLHLYHPYIPILVLSMHEEAIYAERVLRVGACGYISKESPPPQIIFAIRSVLKTKFYLSDAIASSVVRKAVIGRRERTGTLPEELLTDRELQVFQMIGEGRQTPEIAAKLHLDPRTIGTHRIHIKEKLKVDSAANLVRTAVQWFQSRHR